MIGRTAILRTAAAAVVMAALASAPRAASVVAPTFEGLVTRARTVFVAETVDVSSRWVSTGSGRAIVTVVTFKVLRTLKGELGAQTQLEFLGGTVGEYRLEVPGIPRFRVGDRRRGRAVCRRPRAAGEPGGGLHARPVPRAGGARNWPPLGGPP